MQQFSFVLSALTLILCTQGVLGSLQSIYEDTSSDSDELESDDSNNSDTAADSDTDDDDYTCSDSDTDHSDLPLVDNESNVGSVHMLEGTTAFTIINSISLDLQNIQRVLQVAIETKMPQKPLSVMSNCFFN